MVLSAKADLFDENCCGSPCVINQQGIFVCRNCGMVHEYELQYHPPSMYASESKMRCQNQFSPSCDYMTRTTFYLSESPVGKLVLFKRLSRLNNNYRSSRAASLTQARLLVDQIKSQLDLTKIPLEPILVLINTVYNKHLASGRSLKVVISALVYIVCLQYRIECDLAKLADWTQRPLKLLKRCVRLLYRELDLKPIRIDLNQYLLASMIHFDLSDPFQKTALQLATQLKSTNNTFINMRALAVAIIYYVNSLLDEKRISQLSLSDYAHTTEVTLRKYVRIIKKLREK